MIIKRKHGHNDHKEKEKKDHNIHAVFLHYLGDALSSLLVLATALLITLLPNETKWTQYLDPASSLVIVALIMWTTIPLLVACSQILLQQTPANLQLAHLKEKLSSIPGVIGIHDLHVWQLVDDMIIATLHVTLYDTEAMNFIRISSDLKKVLHKYGIHSSTLQPEFITIEGSLNVCKHNCIKDCEEDWCCKADEIDTVHMVDYSDSVQ